MAASVAHGLAELPLRLAGRSASFIGNIQCAASASASPLFFSRRPAYATASLSCSADDKSLRFSAEGIVSHGVGETVAQFAGELEVRLKEAPPGLRKLPLALEHLTQRWLHGREVKLRLFRERDGEGQGSVELVVETRRAAQGRDRVQRQLRPDGVGRGRRARRAGEDAQGARARLVLARLRRAAAGALSLPARRRRS